MGVLTGLQPERVFYYFEELTKIPHGSGNTKEISDYLAAFAAEHGLAWEQDASNNIIIRKAASAGYENAPTVILQGHCDMVCEKKPGSAHDFSKDPLKLGVDGDEIYAEDTTLGGDDGIAVAYMMAILEDDTLAHPALEAVVTTDEEIGLLGAAALDTSSLKGKMLLNLDSEEEGILTVSCAGGMTSVMKLPVRRDEVAGVQYRVEITGLVGGHSGAEIDKNRSNANILMGRLLHGLNLRMDYALAELEGGSKDNAITRNCAAEIVIDGAEESVMQEYLQELQGQLRGEYRGSDDGITINVQKMGSGAAPALNPASMQKVLFFLMNLPNGVQKMSAQIPGLVETSLNLGILKLEPDCLTAVSSVRSSVGSAKDALGERLEYLTEFLGGEYHAEGAYPAWEYRADTPLQKLAVSAYEELFGKTPKVEAIHAGLECGLFYEKIPGLDSISFGPDMKDIHTTEERLSISSTERTYRYLLKILEKIR